MAKTVFSKGDSVNAKKWSGTSFLGIYEHMYDDGSHCVVDATTGKRFNVHPDDVKMATEEEAKEQTIMLFLSAVLEYCSSKRVNS